MSVIHQKFLDLSETSKARPLIMGVLNATPDSFFDGGLYLDPMRALAHAHIMLAEGADLLDLGGESTRPGATPVGEAEELRRILPIAELLNRELPDAPWSIDTSKAAVAKAALELGACMINDVSALSADPAMPAVAAGSGCGVVLMHRASAATSQISGYGEAGVCAAVAKFLLKRIGELETAGLKKGQFWVDPGFGFGKSVEDNLSLIKGLPALVSLGYPVLLGTSRKSSLGAVLGGLPENERLEGTAATVALAAFAGVACLRVHDPKEMSRVVRVVQAVKDAR
ncbi:MAG: dihydropteroate synthase [candidate division FCPU426 bacterium]